MPVFTQLCVLLTTPLVCFCSLAPWQSVVGDNLNTVSTKLNVNQHSFRGDSQVLDVDDHEVVMSNSKLKSRTEHSVNTFEMPQGVIPSGRGVVQGDVDGLEEQKQVDSPAFTPRSLAHSLLDQSMTYQDAEEKCLEPPCSPAPGCVFPFTFEGKEYTNCTADGQSFNGQVAYWCSKETTVTEDSHWAICLPKPADGSFQQRAQPGPKSCSAPSQVTFSMQPSCLEGKQIEENKWCTPACAASKMPFLRVKSMEDAQACYDADDTESDKESSGFWGSKLCCSGGKFTPSSFFCMDDIFTSMDKDGNGLVSAAEFENFQLKQSGYTKLAKLEWEGVQRVQREKEAESTGSRPKPQPLDSTNPVVYYYVVVVTSVFLIFAIYVVSVVVKMGSQASKSSVRK